MRSRPRLGISRFRLGASRCVGCRIDRRPSRRWLGGRTTGRCRKETSRGSRRIASSSPKVRHSRSGCTSPSSRSIGRRVRCAWCGIWPSTTVDGQRHGGIAQGVGQALFEEVRYDETGQLVSSTLGDYPLPRAADFPEFELDRTVTPTPRNPLGAKGIGEAGTIGSTPAIVNAVVDALAPFGITSLDMPTTPEKVWRALNRNGATA